jgi:hypothetical protein
VIAKIAAAFFEPSLDIATRHQWLSVALILHVEPVSVEIDKPPLLAATDMMLPLLDMTTVMHFTLTIPFPNLTYPSP